MSANLSITDLLMNRDKIYILPTRFGVAFGFVNLAVLMSAATYANNLTYLLAFALFAVMMLSLIQTHFNFRSVLVEDVSVEGGHADEMVKVNLLLKNASKFDCNLIKAKAIFQKQKIKNRSQGYTVRASDHCFIEILIPVHQRGLFHLKGVQLSSIYPLGLWFTWKYLRVTREVFVYPKIFGQQVLPQPAEVSISEAGLDQAGGDDFSGLRSYVVGDSIRHVDWKIHARTGDLYIKQFNDGGEYTFDINWADVATSDNEQKISQMTAWILDVAQKRESYAISLPGIKIQTGRGDKHLRQCLETLAVYEPKQT